MLRCAWQLFALFLKVRFVCYSLLVLAIIAALYYHIRYLSSPSSHPSSSSFSSSSSAASPSFLPSSSTSHSKHTRFCYAALSGIVGSQSVLFAKCAGTMLVDTFRGRSVFAVHLWSWLIVALLGSTVTFQIHFLNEGLRLYPSSYVIPVYQSFWVLCSVGGGLIFFGEYAGVMDEWGSAVGFPLGVLIAVAGVYVLSQRASTEEEQEEQGAMEREEDSSGATQAEEMDIDAMDGEEQQRKRWEWKQRAGTEEDDGGRRANALARLSRPIAQLPYQPLLAASQSQHVAFPSVSSSSFFFLQLPYPPPARSVRRPHGSIAPRARTSAELQTAPIVSSPVLYMALSSSSPEASYVPHVDGRERERERDGREERMRNADRRHESASKVREQLHR